MKNTSFKLETSTSTEQFFVFPHQNKKKPTKIRIVVNLGCLKFTGKCDIIIKHCMHSFRPLTLIGKWKLQFLNY